jgi:hypothetical protein
MQLLQYGHRTATPQAFGPEDAQEPLLPPIAEDAEPQTGYSTKTQRSQADTQSGTTSGKQDVDGATLQLLSTTPAFS